MTLADAFAVGGTITGKDGAKYKLRPPTIFEQGEFQRWLEDRAHDAIDRSRDTDERKLQRHHLIDVDAGLGLYEWENEYAMRAVWTPQGLSKITAVVCRDQGVTDKVADELVARSMWEIAVKVLKTAAKDPKALRPVLEALGLPVEWSEPASNEPSSSSSSTPPSTEVSPNSAASPTISCSSSTPSSAAPTG
jgi:hypothetical protein